MALAYRGGSILALDSATTTGICEGVPGETPVLETVNFGGREHDAHHDIFARAVKFAARRFVDRPLPGLMVIEGVPPVLDKSLQSGIFGVLTGIATAKGIPVLVASIPAWRLYVLGSGTLKGPVAKARAVELCRHLGWPSQGHDSAEAACLYLWALSKVAPRLVPKFPLFMKPAPTPRRKRAA